MAALYFVDGYHGGIRGHMPEGSWQDILYALKRFPDWKISLEIEPESWEYLRRHDFHTYCNLRAFIENPDTADRIEFISSSYAQPFCWAVNGESNIRQLIHGIEVTKKYFPTAEIDTYAVQEPCFTSCLPQVLNELGYQRMSLKNPTAWGGYMKKMPGEMVWLCGHDGSKIPAVPRYMCEELISCNATEASGYDYVAISQFAEKCSRNGIKAPVGMCLQDLGWSSAPLVQGTEVTYVTWREYFQMFSKHLKDEVFFSQEDIRVSLPWGNRILGEMLSHVRHGENRILQTEKLLAIAQSEENTSDLDFIDCQKWLRAAWEMLMQAQHHDGYICATCGEGIRQWAFRSSRLALDCCALLDRICARCEESISGEPYTHLGKEKEIWLRVYHTTGCRHSLPTEITLGLEPGVQSLHIFNAEGEEIPCQYLPLRTYADGGLGAVLLRFNSSHDGIGYTSYQVVSDSHCLVQRQGLARKTMQNTVEVSTEYLHLVFDLTKGGSIISFLDKQTGRNYAENLSGFGNLRGYFIQQEKFLNNTSSMTKCEFLENGPLCCRLKFSGEFYGTTFETCVTIRQTDPRIDLETSVYFDKETEIGYPYCPNPEEEYLGVRRSSCREDYKLGIQFPTGNRQIEIVKSAPYDIYNSNLSDTRFDSWETIKHNIINGYIDLYERESDTGLCIFCDSINGYSYSEYLFSLTVAFGYHSNFWWGYQPAKGKYTVSYSLLPHSGNWKNANLQQEDAKRREPLLSQRLSQRPAVLKKTLLGSENPSVETVTISNEKQGIMVRLFHAHTEEEPLQLYGDLLQNGYEIVDLKGNLTTKPKDKIGGLEIRTLLCKAEKTTRKEEEK